MRLTKKTCFGYTINAKDEKYINGNDALILASKLGPMEDVEDKLGIDLSILFKAFNSTIFYIKEENKIINFPGNAVLFYIHGGTVCLGKNELNLKDYGVTWALTKEELK